MPAPPPVAAVTVTVHGNVQGVFFRDACRQEARRLGVGGWVTNQPDGTVEAVFEGTRESVDRMVDWAHTGPPHAQVERVETAPAEPAGLETFEVR